MYSVTVFPGTVDRTYHPLPFRSLLCILIILVLALAAPVSAAVYTLNPGDSIQTAINSAGSGDTIILNPGIYNQHDILVLKNIIIQANTSAGGSAADTIIDAESAGRIFNSSWGYSLAIDNLTLRNGYMIGYGGAIYSDSSSTVNVTSSTFSNCSATAGGAIYADGTAVKVTSSSFSNCSAVAGGAIYAYTGTFSIISSTFSNCSAQYGGAIYATNGDILTIKSSTFSNCSAQYGGAIYAYSGSYVTITSSTFSNCSTTYEGGAIHADGTVYVTSSSFSNCSATNAGGAIYAYTYSSTVTITTSTFSNCSAAYGGAIYALEGSFLPISSSTFSNCSATSGNGGAIYTTSSSTVTVTSSTFSNCAADYGGAIYSSSSTATIHFSRIYNDTGTAVYNDIGTVDAADNWWGTNTDPSGSTYGGVTVSPWLVLNITATPSMINTAQTSVIRINITNNSAGSDTTSGGIFVPDGIPVAFALTSGTGSVLPQAGNITSGANTTTFTPEGAGTSTISAMVDGETVSTDITVRSPFHTLNPGDSIQQNITDASDGDTIILNPGIYNEHDITIDKSIIIQANMSAGGSAADTIIDGMSTGRIFNTSWGNYLAIDNLTLRNGHISGKGGAIYSDSAPTLTITSSTFFNCTADSGGAIYALQSHTIPLTITSSTFSNCSADYGGAIYADYSTITFSSSTFSNCSAKYNGGAIGANYASDITITSSTFSNCSATNGGAIFSGDSTTITSSTFSNCSTTSGNGGAIYSGTGTTNIISSTFSYCSAWSGGAIQAEAATITVSSSTFSSCTAVMGGAILANIGSTVTITSSTFSNCSTTGGSGGAIYINTAPITITSSTFSNCSTTGGSGSAIYSDSGTVTVTSSNFSNCLAANDGVIYVELGTVTIHFSRIYNNTGTAVYNNGGTVDAANNWWGTNADPSGYTSGGVTVSPWLVLNITATPPYIMPTQTSAIRVNLTNNSAGTDTTSGGVFVPDGIPVAFAVTGGTGSVLPQAGNITSGANTTSFTPAGAGTSTVSATVDGVTVSTGITVTSPAVASKAGIFRNGLWFLDSSGNGWWDGPVTDRKYPAFGTTGDIPVAGDWNNDGIAEIGVFRNGAWFLDYSGNGWWDGPVTDRKYSAFGTTGDVPVAGNWSGDGKTEIGVFRNGAWYLDYNGNGWWDGPVTDIKYPAFGTTGDAPVAGDWNNDKVSEIGVFRNGAWYLDYSGNGWWDGPVTDLKYPAFGTTGDLPLAGDWNHDGISEIGVFRNGVWYLDFSGNGWWDGPVTDLKYPAFGTTGDKPVAGKW
jgi:hypothetical protein